MTRASTSRFGRFRGHSYSDNEMFGTYISFAGLRRKKEFRRPSFGCNY